MATEKQRKKTRRSTRRDFLRAGAASLAAGSMLSARLAPSGGGSQKKTVRLAIVGGGFGAAHHWHEHPNCEVTAVSDLVESRRARLVQRYGCQNAFASLQEMLEKAAGAFDAVAIFTDAPSHAAHALACLEAGKHVVSACPVALTLEDCRRLKETKERTGLKYMMHESSYYRQECIAARELYRAGEFGRIVLSEVEYYHPGIGGRSHGLSTWQGKRSWRFGFPPMLYPTHSLGLIVGVTGERILRVSCVGQRVSGDFPERKENAHDNPFDNEMALGVTDQGNICRFGVFWTVAAEGERGQWLGEKTSCYMASSGGQAQARKRHGQRWQEWDVPRYWKTERLPPRMRHSSGHGGSATFLSAEFIDAIVEDREPTVDVYESIAMTAPGIVAHESALKGGVQLRVPLFDRA